MTRASFPNDQPIATGYWAVLIAPIGPVLLWFFGVGDHKEITHWLMGWYLVLGSALVFVDFFVRKKFLSTFFVPSIRNWPQTIAAAVWRWAAWLVLILAAIKLYAILPVYQDGWYRYYKEFLSGWILPGWVLLGIPYTIFTLRRRSGLRWDRKDPAVLLLLIGRGFPWGRWPKILRHCFLPRSVRVVWMGLVVKFFFMPIMFKFFIDNGFHVVKDLEDVVSQLQGSPVFSSGGVGTAEALYYLAFNLMVFIDVCLASLGYLITMRWLDAGMRSVDLSPLGWASCLACYMPFNKLVAWQMGLPTTDVTMIENLPLRIAAMAGVMICMGVYLWATLAFGLRFSNLTHRGLFTNGPYRFVRHPAYVAKNLSWWIEASPNLLDFRSLLCLLGWNGIYYLRAITEERHLRRDPRYGEYAKQVKQRFFQPNLKKICIDES
jgi:protein-S-isoprenylcysteine O-methyltransferase Ste14